MKSKLTGSLDIDRSMCEAVELAISGGASIIQLREKFASGADFVAISKAVLEIARAQHVKVIINDRVDIAMVVDADGVHVGQEDIPASLVRQMIGPHKILGVSVKTVAQAKKAQEDGADYLGAGAGLWHA